jgi:hypothetical protein
MKKAALLSTMFLLGLLSSRVVFAQDFTVVPITRSFAGSISQGAAVGDFNGDGKPDLAVVSSCPKRFNGGCSNDTVTILLGNGDGTFTVGNAYSTGGLDPEGIVVGDFNGDGKLDLAVANDNGSTTVTVGVMLGNGDGTFAPVTTYPSVGSAGVGLALGDLNGDGVLDLVVSNATTVSLLLGNKDGTFKAATTYPAFANGIIDGLAVGDFNTDGRLDVAVVEYNLPNNDVAILLGNGDGSLRSPTLYSSGGTGIIGGPSLTTGDFNGDGIVDIAVSNTCTNNQCTDGGSVGVLMGNGDGTFKSAQTYPTGPGVTFSLVAGDFTKDGRIDLAVGVVCAVPSQNNGCLSLAGLVAVLLGNGDGTFQAPQNYSSGGDAPLDVVLGDFNLDGRLDLAVVNSQDSFGSLSQSEVGVLLGVNPAAVLKLSTASISFSPQIVGTASPQQSLTVTNSGAVAIGIPGIFAAGTNSGDFAVTHNCPETLGTSASCTANVVFKPSSTSSESTSLTISTTAPVEPHLVPMTGSGGDFSIGPASGQPTSATFAAGQSATLNLQVNPIGGFAGPVSLACTGAPAESTCTPSASSVNVTGATSAPFSVAVTSTARGLLPPGPLHHRWPRIPQLLVLYTVLAIFCALITAHDAVRRNRLRAWDRAVILVACLSVALITASGCGSGGSSAPPPPTGTPAGTYTLTVTGTSQGQNRTLNLTLTVN